MFYCGSTFVLFVCYAVSMFGFYVSCLGVLLGAYFGFYVGFYLVRLCFVSFSWFFVVV